MKMKDIVVGEEYAFGRQDEWRGWPRRVRVLEVGLRRQIHSGGRSMSTRQSARADGVKVQTLDRETGESTGDIGRFRTDVFVTLPRFLRQLWSEFEVDDDLRKGRAAAHEAEQLKRRKWLTTKATFANERLGEEFFVVKNVGLTSRSRYEIQVQHGTDLMDAVLREMGAFLEVTFESAE